MKHTPRLATALTAIVMLAILSVAGIQQPAAATLELSWPCDGSIILPFGETNLTSPRFHRGIDIAAPEGTEVKSPISGTVRFAGFTPAGGGTVSIDIGGGWRVTLLQLENISVRAAIRSQPGTFSGAWQPQVTHPPVNRTSILGLSTRMAPTWIQLRFFLHRHRLQAAAVLEKARRWKSSLRRFPRLASSRELARSLRRQMERANGQVIVYLQESIHALSHLLPPKSAW
jgi:hypothetical protein